MLILVTTGMAGEVVVGVAVQAVSWGSEVTTGSDSLGTLIVSLGMVAAEAGEWMTEVGAEEDDEDEMGDDSSELILVSLEQLSSEVAAAGLGGIGLMVSFGMGTSEGSRGMAGGGLGIGLIVSFGIVDVMLECWSLGEASGGVTSLGEKLLLVDDTSEASLDSSELVLMVSLGRGGSGIGLMVNLTPSELVKTGTLFGTTAGSGFALMCSFGIAGGFEDCDEDESSSLAIRLFRW